VIIITKPKLRFLDAGRAITLTVARPRRVGRDYPAGPRHGHPVTRVHVHACTQTPDGWELKLTQHRIDQAIYLAASPGSQHSDYTTNPARAAREPGGSPIEAAPDTRYARDAYKRDDALRRQKAAQRQSARSKRYSVQSSLPRRAPLPD
jgi:hypothetical protein